MKKTVLIVDDNAFSREILSDILSDEYEILEADNGESGIVKLKSNLQKIAVLLLDVNMPKMNGYQMMGALAKEGLLEKIPVLIITGDSDIATEQACFTVGAYDFIRKPFDTVIAKMRIKNAITVYEYRNSLQKLVDEKTAKLQKINSDIIEVMANLVEARNQESGKHIKRVKKYTNIIAKKLAKKYPEYRLNDDDIAMITLASAMHDVGKIMIPDNILLKPGKLTSEEFEIMKTHSEKGAEIIKSVQNDLDEDYYKFAYDISYYHHERFDGKGYPCHLSGDEIPISAQIVAVADCCDALSTDRVYKAAFSMEKTFEMITGGECGSFNPKIMDCFISARKEIEKVHDEI